MFSLLVACMHGVGEMKRFHQALSWQAVGFALLLVGYFVITRVVCRKNRTTDPSTP